MITMATACSLSHTQGRGFTVKRPYVSVRTVNSHQSVLHFRSTKVLGVSFAHFALWKTHE